MQSRLKQIEKMQTIKLPRATKKIRYSFPAPPRSGSDVISLTNVSKSYGDNMVYQGIDLTLSARRPCCVSRTERRREDHVVEDTRGRHSI